MLTLFHRRWMRMKSWLSCSIGTRHRFASQSCRLLGDAQFVFIVLTIRAHAETKGWNSGLRQVCRNAQRHGCVDRSRRVAFGVLQNIVPWTATMSSLSSPSSLSFNRIIPTAWELNQLLMMRPRPPCDSRLLAKARLSTLRARTSRGAFVTSCDYTTFLFETGSIRFSPKTALKEVSVSLHCVETAICASMRESATVCIPIRQRMCQQKLFGLAHSRSSSFTSPHDRCHRGLPAQPAHHKDEQASYRQALTPNRSPA